MYIFRANNLGIKRCWRRKPDWKPCLEANRNTMNNNICHQNQIYQTGTSQAASSSSSADACAVQRKLEEEYPCDKWPLWRVRWLGNYTNAFSNRKKGKGDTRWWRWKWKKRQNSQRSEKIVTIAHTSGRGYTKTENQMKWYYSLSFLSGNNTSEKWESAS